MKRIITNLFLCWAGTVSAQNYVDIAKFTIGNVQNVQFAGTSESTDIDELEFGLTYPIKLSSGAALITGIDYSNYQLGLMPTSSNLVSLQSTTLRIGLSKKHSDKWSGTYLLLPKIAADYRAISSSDFQLGGVVLYTYTKKANLKYKFGLYATSEVFGMFFVPIAGLYYTSKDEKFEVNATMPISLDVNYKLQKWLTVGADYMGFVRSWILSEEALQQNYVHKNSKDFSGYLQFNLLEGTLLLQTKAAYSINDYGMFDQNDKIDFGLTALRFGDNRERLNPDFEGALSLRLKLIYRFHL